MTTKGKGWEMQGHIRQRGKTWQYTIDLGRDASGKRHQKAKGGFHRKAEAQSEMHRVMRELDTGAYAEPSKMTVAAYLRKWLKDYARTNVAESTYPGYELIIKKHLIPTLGYHSLSMLKPLHIQSYYSQALESGCLDDTGGLKSTTVLQHHRILRRALKQAIKWQLLSINPADGVDPPRKATTEIVILDEQESMKLIRAAEGTRYHIPILLAATMGMRRGEILGLRWCDVDLDEGRVHVRQALFRINGENKFKEPKTPKSRRSITMPSLTTEALKSLKRRQADERLALGPAYNDLDLVCCRADGKHLSLSSCSKAVPDLAIKTGLPNVTMKGLRHSHASHLLRQGQHPKIVSSRLGHSAIGITMDTYSHMMPGMDEGVPQDLDEVYRGASMEG